MVICSSRVKIKETMSIMYSSRKSKVTPIANKTRKLMPHCCDLTPIVAKRKRNPRPVRCKYRVVAHGGA